MFLSSLVRSLRIVTLTAVSAGSWKRDLVRTRASTCRELFSLASIGRGLEEVVLYLPILWQSLIVAKGRSLSASSMME